LTDNYINILIPDNFGEDCRIWSPTPCNFLQNIFAIISILFPNSILGIPQKSSAWEVGLTLPWVIRTLYSVL